MTVTPIHTHTPTHTHTQSGRHGSVIVRASGDACRRRARAVRDERPPERHGRGHQDQRRCRCRCVYVCVCVCLCARARARVHVRVCVVCCVLCVCVHMYDSACRGRTTSSGTHVGGLRTGARVVTRRSRRASHGVCVCVWVGGWVCRHSSISSHVSRCVCVCVYVCSCACACVCLARLTILLSPVTNTLYTRAHARAAPAHTHTYTHTDIAESGPSILAKRRRALPAYP